jgi:membrane associated rhomboid family serine protease
MFPIADDNSEIRTIPFVTYAILGLNIIVFVLLQGLGSNDGFTYAFSLVPLEIINGVDVTTPPLQPTPSVYFTLISSMFMHGDFMHIIGNMLFLWIFADNIENLIGHFRFAAFYLICGFAAAFAQVFMDTSSVIPMLGASGAISGVLGGYLLLFPNKQVRAVMFSFMMTTIPAFVAVGLWIGFQVIQGYLSSGQKGGVAYAAHIGGFIAGVVLIKFFAIGKNAS